MSKIYYLLPMLLLTLDYSHGSASEVPSFDELAPMREKIRSRAEYINHAAKVSSFERTGRMPDSSSIPNADCVFVPKEFFGGYRAMIYRRVNKSGSQTVLYLLRKLCKELTPNIETKFRSFKCDHPDLEVERSKGAVDFAIVREPLDRWVSGYFFLGRASKMWENLAHYAREMMMWEHDVHGLPQSFFYSHSSRRNQAHSAVIQLENIAEEWPALISLVFAGPEGSVLDDSLFKRVMESSVDVPVKHRNKGADPPCCGEFPPTEKVSQQQSIKTNPLGGGPGSGFRFLESRSDEELLEVYPHLCAFLEHDYVLLADIYEVPSFCMSHETKV